MPDQSSTSALPAAYRLGLAVSLALLAHTLLLSGLPTPFVSQPDRHRESLSVELVTEGSRPSSPKASGQPSTDRKATPIPPFELQPEITTVPSPEVVTTNDTRRSPPPAKQPAPAPAEPVQQPDTSSSPSPATSSQTASPSRAGSQAPAESALEPEPMTRITRSPAEADPYLVKLATHLARELENMRVPAISQLPGPVAMEVELQLLGNGALTRARVVKSTGVANIDRAAYRAALAASPYPEPPGASPGENRFEVELLFTPKRL